MNQIKNYGLELIMHKFLKGWPSKNRWLSSDQLEEVFKELNEVGVVFEKINAFSTSAFIFTNQKKSGSMLRHIEFVIIKSVANHINLKYGIQPELKYPDPEVQKYFKRIKPLSIEDLLERCNKILKKKLKLKLK